ncbi:isopenicillin N synthase family dioxygenase [Hyalangium rubrum]|uniref:2-oxoglutarate-dependent ethylene/succinate-forming enzyme n=1 Tax=Hyalangium rubrum TaxID=3103134 RepID=A0ABU5GWU0_9BACT|nr:2-oxoglutarate and iron-dependent oxygenase domain-containing protein [Hyalangium sp. s54d21]MDY7225660.1 2-oxoglutarate and iron-dependent oxygenase domain-containing protein [Hyalangium sp. s54d21]
MRMIEPTAAVPILDARLLEAGPEARARFVTQLVEACRGTGCFQLLHPPLPSGLSREALQAARDFFALPLEEKLALDIAHSQHFRGYSRMSNGRDWREQLHLGREEPPGGLDSEPTYLRLQGPNPWPRDERWRRVFLTYLHAVEAVGHQLLEALAQGLGLTGNPFAEELAKEPYLVMKLIHYLPQPGAEAPPRSGVASHCDFSWLTLLLQDELGGLQVRSSSGEWVDVEPRPDALVVNLGELMQMATRGVFQATPHRVTNRSHEKARTSIPVFLCPNLRSRVTPLPVPHEWAAPPCVDPAHVHRVVPLERMPRAEHPLAPFVFGEAEWKRKGRGIWCAECCA